MSSPWQKSFAERLIGTIRRCKYGATIDKYVGDAIIMFFGDPATRGVKEDALACVQMAIAMQERVGELAEEGRQAGPCSTP